MAQTLQTLSASFCIHKYTSIERYNKSAILIASVIDIFGRIFIDHPDKNGSQSMERERVRDQLQYVSFDCVCERGKNLGCCNIDLDAKSSQHAVVCSTQHGVEMNTMSLSRN